MPERQERIYPRIKVREEHNSVLHHEETKVLLMRIAASRSIESKSSSRAPVTTSGNRQSRARVTKSSNALSPGPSIPSRFKDPGKGRRSLSPAPAICRRLKETEKTSKHENDDKLNIRASSVPRPRAVLSSPDNDDIIGYMNKRTKERPIALKAPYSDQSLPVERKTAARSASTGRPARQVRDTKENHVNSSSKAKQPSQPRSPRLRF